MTSQQGPTSLQERTNHALLACIRDNIGTQYGSQATSLAELRDAISTHGTEVDATLLVDFRAHVPFSDYDSYKPFVDKFNVQPCKEEDIVNMFAPGLPDFFAVSSGTSGGVSKILPKYNYHKRLGIPTHLPFDQNSKDPLAGAICTGYKDLKVIERASGEVVQKIPVCIVSGGYLRRHLEWYVDDEMSGYAVPWAATVIDHFPSFLIVHGLFFLASKNISGLYAPFSTHFVDLISHINEHWDMLVSCIRDGKLPDLKGIDHVRNYLEAHFHPNPERAIELLEIGPPFSSEGWASRVWPAVGYLLTICTGQFAFVLPKVRSILGPNIPVRCPGYGSSESTIGYPHDPNKLDEFMLRGYDIVEFLDVSLDATIENIRQPWEVEVGKHYEPILTTRDGLWRYQLGDILCIIGFHTESGSPLFKYVGRRTLTLRLPLAQITDTQLLSAIETFSSDNAVRVQEFTTVIDDRALLPTVGFLVELARPLGSNAHLALQKLSDSLVTTNAGYGCALEQGRIRLPTIRILKAGTFAEYRQWKGETANIASGQIKVPLVLLNPTAQEWILERVVQEL